MTLQELDLGDSDTDIVTVDDLSMSQLCVLAPGLKVLSLSRCRWVSSCEPLKGLGSLQALDLSHTDVGPKALEALAELPALQSLNLTGCRSVAADCAGAVVVGQGCWGGPVDCDTFPPQRGKTVSRLLLSDFAVPVCCVVLFCAGT
jgi:hypothetical protein